MASEVSNVNLAATVTKRGQGKRTKIKLTDRISALKLIGQQHGMFKSETTVNGGTPIPVVLSAAEQLL